ncbi:hypothetical protein BAMBUS_00680 [Brevundimonas phage vB_BpoS-Bambus]|nr:hypothetical protein BAMBUS_00680 [Brevundimonas phage vB_BpoS-Bambus]
MENIALARPDTYVAVLTYKSVDQILREGGTQSWRADRSRLRRTGWVICARNLHGPYSHKGETADVEHKHAFLIGEVGEIVDADDGDGRQKITFERYALVDGPLLIPFKGKNPVQYFDSGDLDIDLNALIWIEVDPIQEPKAVVDQAKDLVADHFGVPPENVRITITL